LTIDENKIEADGETHRRSGLHTESPGIGAHRVENRARDYDEDDSYGGPSFDPKASGGLQHFLSWGAGSYCTKTATAYCSYIGGIFMSSNVGGSTAVWNCELAHLEDTIGDLGDLEHLRSGLGRLTLLAAGELLWLTDMTPHESLPLSAGTARQYFRLLTREVSIWYT